MLIKGSKFQLIQCSRTDRPLQDLIDLIIRPVFIVKLQIIGKILCHPRMLQILDDHLLIHGKAQLFIGSNHF